jgi:hypothetical protein
VADRAPARLSAAEGRKFGLTVGAAFLALGTVALWRGRRRTAVALQALGAALVLAGIVAPTALGPVQRAWMALAHRISKVTTPLFLGAVYFLVITPAGVVRRRTGGPFAARRQRSASRWEPHEPTDAARMERQF